MNWGSKAFGISGGHALLIIAEQVATQKVLQKVMIHGFDIFTDNVKTWVLQILLRLGRWSHQTSQEISVDMIASD